MEQSLPEAFIKPYLGGPSCAVSLLLHGESSSVSLSGHAGVACAPEDLIVEIGSITKVFTALLLAVLVEEGRVDPDRPIRDVCKDLAAVPSWVTPGRLATHNAGLPRLHVPVWKVLLSPHDDDPYAAFTQEDMFNWLRNWTAGKPPKSTSNAYSNLGFGLLGEVLAIHEGERYHDLLTRKIMKPLGLHDTAAHLQPDQSTRFLQPYDCAGRPVPAWTFKAMAGAGALKSSMKDLAHFATRVMTAVKAPETSLDRAIVRSIRPRIGLGPKGVMEPVAQCWGWLSMKLGTTAPAMLFHDGGTAGSTSALYLCPEKQAAIAILANRGVAASVWPSMKLSWSNPHRVASEIFDSL